MPFAISFLCNSCEGDAKQHSSGDGRKNPEAKPAISGHCEVPSLVFSKKKKKIRFMSCKSLRMGQTAFPLRAR
jgi:hypothetical protein